MSHTKLYMKETELIASQIEEEEIEAMAEKLALVRKDKGRLFIAGLGGSAANASHAASDFRKLCGIQACSLTDNAPELTARANDEGWDTVFAAQVEAWGTPKDALMVLSVGGGSEQVSVPLVRAMDAANKALMWVFAIVGRDGGYAAHASDSCLIIPTVESSRVTPHAEGWQMVVLHCLVSNPKLQLRSTKW